MVKKSKRLLVRGVESGSHDLGRVRAFDGHLSLAGAVKASVFFSKFARMDILTKSKRRAAPALPSLHSLLD